MHNQLDVSAAPGWLRRMWVRRQGPDRVETPWGIVIQQPWQMPDGAWQPGYIYHKWPMSDGSDIETGYPFPEVPEWE